MNSGIQSNYHIEKTKTEKTFLVTTIGVCVYLAGLYFTIGSLSIRVTTDLSKEPAMREVYKAHTACLWCALCILVNFPASAH